MARNKMEKEFAEKLNLREIQPSAAAWDRLDAMLTASESHVSIATAKKSYKWLYIAASFLGFLLIGTLFFKKADTKNAAIENADKQVVEAQTHPKTKQIIVKPQAPAVQVAQVPDQKVAAVQKAAVPLVKLKSAGSKFVSEESQLADNTINHQSPNPIILQKTNTLHQADPASGLGTTADELLAAAQAKRESGATGAKVNARSLLSQVDSQAEEKLTLKQKAMRALNKNYQQVKVAVENRNIEENH